MFWYNVRSDNSSYYFKMYISEITKFPCQLHYYELSSNLKKKKKKALTPGGHTCTPPPASGETQVQLGGVGSGHRPGEEGQAPWPVGGLPCPLTGSQTGQSPQLQLSHLLIRVFPSVLCEEFYEKLVLGQVNLGNTAFGPRVSLADSLAAYQRLGKVLE